MSRTGNRPAGRNETLHRKSIAQSPGPKSGLPWYLYHAPKDASFKEVYEAWDRGDDPREVWPDE